MGDGAGLALVHHLKAVAPDGHRLRARRRAPRSRRRRNAVALGGAGLIMMPLGGDEILSAISAVKVELADRADARRARAGARSRTRAPRRGRPRRRARRRARAGRPPREQLVEVLLEATGAPAPRSTSPPASARRARPRGGEPRARRRARRSAWSPTCWTTRAREQLLVVPLCVGALRGGARAPVSRRRRPRGSAPARSRPDVDGARDAARLAGDAARSRCSASASATGGGATIKDPASSAYSFAYYVDVAGREIDKARRYGRRFAIATVAFERVGRGRRRPPMGHAEMADQLLKAARDTDVLAHVDEHEFHLLMPETDGLGAHAARRRVLARLVERGGKALPRGLLVGVSTFPHDGADLSQLLRVARRRAEATRHSLVRRLAADQSGLADILDALGWELEAPPPDAISAARPLELPIADAVGARGDGGRRRRARRRHAARRRRTTSASAWAPPCAPRSARPART